MKNDNRDRIYSHIFLMIYLVCNGVLTGATIKWLRVIGTRDYTDKDFAPMLLLVLCACGLSAQRVIHHYNKLYKNKQK